MVGELALQEELGAAPEAAEVEVNDAPAEQEQVEDKPDYEKIARDRGWRPKEEYKGDPANWAPADEYVKLTEENVVFQRRAIDNLSKQVEAVTKGQQQIIEQAEREKKAAAAEAYSRAMAEMEQRLNTAIAEGDTAAATNAIRIRDQIKEDHIKTQIPVRGEDPVVSTWKKENSWYESNPLLNDWATKQCQELARQGLPASEQLKRVTETVKQTFPHLFTNPNRESAPVMTAKTTSTAPINRNVGAPKYDGLTAEAKRNCDSWVRAAKYSFAGQSEDALRARWVATADKESFKN